MRSVLAATVVLVQLGVVYAQCPGSVTASVCGLSKASYPDWMGRLPNDRLISDLSIPATHDSLAIVGGSLTQCQENYGQSADTLTAQLKAGIRGFDIRLRIAEGNKFTIHHGPTYQNANFDDVLTKLRSFLEANPTETVLIRAKRECRNEFLSCNDAPGDFESIFRSYVSAYPTVFWAPAVNGRADIPRLGDVRGKAVLMVLHGNSGGPYGAFGLHHFAGWTDGSTTYVQDDYNVANTGAIATKRDKVRRFLDVTSAGDKSKIYVNFGSGSSILAHPFTIANGAAPSTTGVNPFLLGYMREGPEVHAPVVRTGVMMLDFPGADLITQIINTNQV
ncbi:PLC-like phosphodiesterase [Pterulicium gracile]|uniref:PLC-like phosphodiesterase n=1 Tax=Pterulicium gracile TaxID=1884261 RepID=A0A5C3QAC8_9AGAR|nr:PLC-like phosphodiesterase [Pterula gracilis]